VPPSDIGFVSNIEDRLPLGPAAGRFNNAIHRRMPPALTRKGRLRYAPSEAYRALTRKVSIMVTQPYRDLLAAHAMPWAVERFCSFFVARGHAQAKPVFVHKFTGWPRAGFIRVAFPDARFIHAIRDGRAGVASDLQVSWWRGYLGRSTCTGPWPPSTGPSGRRQAGRSRSWSPPLEVGDGRLRGRPGAGPPGP